MLHSSSLGFAHHSKPYNLLQDLSCHSVSDQCKQESVQMICLPGMQQPLPKQMLLALLLLMQMEDHQQRI